MSWTHPPRRFGGSEKTKSVASDGGSDVERVTVVRAPALPGLEVWDIRNSSRRWMAYKTSYSFSALTRFVSPGEELWRYRGAVYAMTTRSAKLLEPNEFHATLRTTTTSFLSLEVEPEHLNELCRDRLGNGRAGAVRFRVGQLDDGTARRHLVRACRAIATAAIDPLLAEGALLTFLERALELQGEARSEGRLHRTDRGLARAREYLHDEFRSALTLDAVARVAGLSKFHLAHAFRKTYGVGIHRYLVHVRLAHATAALRRGAAPRDVARATGFCDQPHLTRTFRSQLGLTPVAFARSRR